MECLEYIFSTEENSKAYNLSAIYHNIKERHSNLFSMPLEMIWSVSMDQTLIRLYIELEQFLRSTVKALWFPNDCVSDSDIDEEIEELFLIIQEEYQLN